jgi:hypothetical protein
MTNIIEEGIELKKELKKESGRLWASFLKLRKSFAVTAYICLLAFCILLLVTIYGIYTKDLTLALFSLFLPPFHILAMLSLNQADLCAAEAFKCKQMAKEIEQMIWDCEESKRAKLKKEW